MSRPPSFAEEFFREVLVSSVHGVVVGRTDGRIVFANDAVREITGYDRSEVLERSVSDLCQFPESTGPTPVQALDGEQSATRGPREAVLMGAAGSEIPVIVSIEATTFDRETYVVLRLYREAGTGETTDSLERRRPAGSKRVAEQGGSDGTEDQGAPLQADGKRWSDTPSPPVVRQALAAIRQLFETEIACLRSVDTERTDLRPVAETSRARDLRDSRPGFDLGATHAGRAYRRGEPVMDDPVGESDSPLERPSVHVPVGDWGTLSVFLPEGAAAGNSTIESVDAVGSLLTATLSESDAAGTFSRGLGVRGSVEYLAAGHTCLAGIQRGFDAVLSAESAAAVRSRLCEGLAAGDGFEAVRVIEPDSNGTASVWAPDGEVSRERSDFAAAFGSGAIAESISDVARAPTATGTVRYDVEVQAPNGTGPSNPEESVVLVSPIGYEDRRFGVLVAECAALGTFGDIIEDSIATLAAVAGLTLFTHKNRELVLSERRTELEFEVTGSSCLAVPVSADLDCRCAIEHNTLTNDGDHSLYLRADHPDAEAVIQAALTVDSVTGGRPVWETDGSCLVEITKTESGAEAMMDVGATITEASAAHGVGTLVVQTPQSVDTGAVADAYMQRNPDSRLVSKRSVDRPVDTVTNVGSPLEEELTEKQQSALVTAFHAGYFNWPRDSTAQEVASSLGVTSPTFQQHLRIALQNLVQRHTSSPAERQ